MNAWFQAVLLGLIPLSSRRAHAQRHPPPPWAREKQAVARTTPSRYIPGFFESPLYISYIPLGRMGISNMASYLLKASDEKMDAWRSASVRLGFPSLAAFIRAGADALAGVPVELRAGTRETANGGPTEASGSAVASGPAEAWPLTVATPEQGAAMLARPFTPDFGKRLKP